MINAYLIATAATQYFCHASMGGYFSLSLLESKNCRGNQTQRVCSVKYRNAYYGTGARILSFEDYVGTEQVVASVNLGLVKKLSLKTNGRTLVLQTNPELENGTGLSGTYNAPGYLQTADCTVRR